MILQTCARGKEREVWNTAHTGEQKIINIFVWDLSREREREGGWSVDWRMMLLKGIWNSTILLGQERAYFVFLNAVNSTESIKYLSCYHRKLTLKDNLFYIYGSVHHNLFFEMTNRCSCLQSILFHCQVHSTRFGRFTHPSSGVQF